MYVVTRPRVRKLPMKHMEHHWAGLVYPNGGLFAGPIWRERIIL